jgi:putative MATE family efflux protein
MKHFFQDRRFFSTLLKIAVPITIQQFISSMTNMLDVLMIGQLGEISIAALGLSNQIFFLLSILLFGISSGSAIFTAQYWGNKDLSNLKRVMGIGLSLGIGIAVVYTFIALFLPEKILSFYTNDVAVIELGSQYLRIVGISYIFTAITFTFVSILRSTENVKLPMVITIITLSLNMFLNYVLIFGNFGLPKMGVSGAALGTTIARIIECIVIVFFAYKLKTPASARLSELRYSFSFLKKVLQTSLPAAVNELFWSLGITTYNAVFAHIGTNAIAAVNINSTIESMAFVIFIGIANACSIMIGNRIGAGDEETAYDYANRFLILAFVGAILIGIIVIIIRPAVLSLYNIEPLSYKLAMQILLVFGAAMWIRVTNLMIFIGILRAGGDTRFALYVEMGSIWLIGVPVAVISAFVFHLPVYWVYTLIMAEEVVKLLFVYPRFKSKKWIHNLAETVKA